jgi:hypothetical protein
MPWTFAHPAAVMPFRHLGPIRMPLIGLVSGSIVPDLGYYIGRFDLATYAHSADGMVFFCLPVAFFLVLLLTRFHQFLIAPLPNPHREALARLSPPPLWPLPQTIWLAVAVIVGASTHVAWDSFTHINGAAVIAIPILREKLFVLAGRPIAAYNVLQHTSTLFGIAVLSIVYRRWLKCAATSEASLGRDNRRRYVHLSVAVALSLALGLSVALLRGGQETSLSVAIVRGAIYSTAAFLAAYAALALHARTCNA